MKRFFAVIAAVGLLAGMLAGCSAKTEASSAAPSAAPSSSSQAESQTSSAASAPAQAVLAHDFAEGTRAYENFGISCEVPKAWQTSTSKGGSDNFYPSVENGTVFLMIQFTQTNNSLLTEEQMLAYAEGMEEMLTEPTRTKCSIEENPMGSRYVALNLEGEMNGRAVRVYNAAFDVPDGVVLVGLLEDVDCEKDFSEDFQCVVDTVRVVEKTAQESQSKSESEVAGASEAPKAASETMGQRNAVSKAKDYLRVMAFSHSGLVQQLEFEGFTNEEATYAADQCGADWSVRASKKAQDYLDTMSFSRSGLIKQLEFEGFTNEEATGAVDACGADWNEQAAQKAQDYLDTMSMSRSGLLQQLQFEGFTAEQAEYGVAAVGY